MLRDREWRKGYNRTTTEKTTVGITEKREYVSFGFKFRTAKLSTRMDPVTKLHLLTYPL